jgi:hypothetical protein
VPFRWPHGKEKEKVTLAGIKGLSEPSVQCLLLCYWAKERLSKWVQANDPPMLFYEVRAGTDRFAGHSAEAVGQQLQYARSQAFDRRVSKLPVRSSN